MCRLACIWSLFIVLATATSGRSQAPQPPAFHPIMARYTPGAHRGAAVAGRADISGTTSVGSAPAARAPFSLVSWVNAIRELSALLTLKSTITCTTWSQIKLCYLIPPGQPGRPECCDGYPPKDPVEPPGQ